MAIDLIMEKRGARLTPTDSVGLESIDAIKDGEQVRVTIRRARNPGHHRKFFAVLQAVHENQTRFATVEDLLDALKIALGHYEVWKIGRREIVRPKSISFASMDQATFQQFYDHAVELILTRLLPGLERSDLERRVVEILEGRTA